MYVYAENSDIKYYENLDKNQWGEYLIRTEDFKSLYNRIDSSQYTTAVGKAYVFDAWVEDGFLSFFIEEHADPDESYEFHITDYDDEYNILDYVIGSDRMTVVLQSADSSNSSGSSNKSGSSDSSSSSGKSATSCRECASKGYDTCQGHTCEICNGQGDLVCNGCHGAGKDYNTGKETKCPVCYGSGRQICPNCNGGKLKFYN